MLTAPKLLRDRLDPFNVRHTEGIDGNSRTEVNIFLSRFVVNERAYSRNDLYGKTRVGSRDIFAVNILDSQSFHPPVGNVVNEDVANIAMIYFAIGET